MGSVLKSSIIRIGNSQGVRIPKVWLEQLQLGSEVELSLQPDGIVIQAALRPRQGWEESFSAMAGVGDDRLLDPPARHKFDKDEWEW